MGPLDAIEKIGEFGADRRAHPDRLQRAPFDDVGVTFAERFGVAVEIRARYRAFDKRQAAASMISA